MNWGYKIAIIYLLFVGMTLFMVYRSMQEKVDLVANDYYDQELKYQERIDRKKATGKLSRQLMVKQDSGILNLSFPPEAINKQIEGNIYFFCPSDASHDLKIPIQAKAGMQQINLEPLQKGLYRMQVAWSSDGVDYYSEQEVIIN